ncbi:phage major capsid protein [Gluconobacter oxydans]|uniref:phage major capsid protein n=1 Tax=Gluconobacter oxydans TaxID=442 RepID=UPI0026497EAF|nr:phage major capsid protein [Gluconobacter oxydans]WKE49046.1 phage major capsid protein [Gluconobacter oxydans]
MNIEGIITRLNAENGGAVRSAVVEGVDREARTVQLAFSSEGAEVPRWFGTEILGHDPGEADLTRLNDSAALLMDHNTRDQVGVVVPGTARLDADGKGRATVRFGKSPRAEEVFNDVADEIRKHVSVGYRVTAMKHVETRENGDDVYRITGWEPYEISFVGVPADHSVGVGRNYSTDEVESNESTLDNEAPESNPAATPAPENNHARSQVNENEVMERARSEEQKRVKDILDLGRQYGASDLAAEHAGNPTGSTETLSRALLERQGKQAPLGRPNSDVGMEKRDLAKFSVVRIARALANPQDRKAQDAAGFERELSDAARSKQVKSDSGNWVIPSDVLRSAVFEGHEMARRDAQMSTGSNGQTGAGSTGENLVATNLLASSYIDILRNKATFTHGVAMLGGLIGNLDIPKQTAATQGYWIGEGDDATESNMDFGQLTMSPKTLAAYTDVTRRFLMQSSLDVESLVRRDLARSMGLAIDLSGYYGSGSEHQPTGLKNLAGIASKTFAGAQPTFGELVDMETEVALANADVEGMRYKARADFRGHAKQTLKFPGTPSAAGTIWEPGNTVNGYACDITNQIKSGDMFFGNFADVLMGMWGGLEMMVDPYSNSKSGGVRIVTFQDIDWQVRRVESFVIGSAAAAPPAGH